MGTADYSTFLPSRLKFCTSDIGSLFPVEGIQVILGCAPQEIVQRIGMSVKYAEGGWGILRAMHNGVIKG